MKLSIITINRNNAVGLEKTIKSVISQSFHDYEYIVIDGCSIDNSVEIINKFCSQINQWVSEKDNGIYNAMNKGLAIANGEYIYFLNSGDILYSDNTLYEVFNQNINKDYIFGAIKYDYRNKEKIVYLPNELSYSFLLRFGINHQATFTKRSLFIEYGFYDECLYMAADWKFLILSLCKHNASFQTVKTIISIYDPFGASSTNEKIIQNEKKHVIFESFPLFKNDYERYFKLNRYTFKGLKNIIRHTLHNWQYY